VAREPSRGAQIHAAAGRARGPLRQRDEPRVVEGQSGRVLRAGQLPVGGRRLHARDSSLRQSARAVLESGRVPLQAAQPHQGKIKLRLNSHGKFF